MKLLRSLTLLAPAVLATPLIAQAAMDPSTRDTFITECVSAAGQTLNASAAKAHCDCGAEQVNKHFSDAQISQLNDTTKAPSPVLINRLQQVVAEGCVQPKK